MCNWKVGKDNLSFWHDNWNLEFSYSTLTDGYDGDLLSDFRHEDHRDFEALVPTLGEELTHYTLEHAPIISEDKDMLLWKLTKDGAFSVNATWESVRRRGAFDPVAKVVWDSVLPNQNKILIWRLLRSILPTDLTVRRSGFQLASKCICCAKPNEESIQHLFIDGDLAASLWKYFGAIFGVRYFPN